MALAEHQITVDDFEAFLEEHPNGLYELIHGEIVETYHTPLQGVIAVNIGAEIKIYLKSNPIGYVGTMISHQSRDDDFNERLPSVSFRKVKREDLLKKGAVPTMPDLAIEIKSPTDTYTLMREKAQYYLDNGTLLVWLVYPEKKFVEVYRNGADDIDFLTGEDVLSGYDVLPNFELAVNDIFP